jgi:hypothetical protein
MDTMTYAYIDAEKLPIAVIKKGNTDQQLST